MHGNAACHASACNSPAPGANGAAKLRGGRHDTCQGRRGRDCAVLGLGRSGLSAARALRAGGAQALCWDDNPQARAQAEAEGLEVRDLTRAGAFDGSPC